MEVTASLALTENQYGYTHYLTDGNRESYMNFYQGTTLTIRSDTPFRALYLTWWTPPAPYAVTVGEAALTGGENEFLHEYLTLPEDATEVSLTFAGVSQLCELRAFTEGEPGEDVQCWVPPCEEADVLLLPSHADDDVIFFGAMAALCVDRGAEVQVCYLVNHYDWQPRPQELLDALWTMGIRHYPVIGPFPDHYVLNLQGALTSFGLENVVDYQVELIRRFRPLVVAGHDRQGEYGHGAHMVNSMALEQAIVLAGDETYQTESVEKYGVWDAPKLYLHMAEENEIWLDAETPLASFGGKTALEVAQEAMLCHETQLQYAHRPMLAVEIPEGATEDERNEKMKFARYDCRRFGLVRSLVGADSGNDILENTEDWRDSHGS